MKDNFDIHDWRLKQALNELSSKQKKIAAAAEPKDKITGDDFKALRSKKSIHEQPTEMIYNAEYLEEDDWMQTDDESDMAHSQLYNIKEISTNLCNMIGKGEQLDAWVQAKLTKAEDYLSSVYNYLNGEEHEQQDKNIITGGQEDTEY